MRPNGEGGPESDPRSIQKNRGLYFSATISRGAEPGLKANAPFCLRPHTTMPSRESGVTDGRRAFLLAAAAAGRNKRARDGSPNPGCLDLRSFVAQANAIVERHVTCPLNFTVTGASWTPFQLHAEETDWGPHHRAAKNDCALEGFPAVVSDNPGLLGRFVESVDTCVIRNSMLCLALKTKLASNGWCLRFNGEIRTVRDIFCASTRAKVRHNPTVAVRRKDAEVERFDLMEGPEIDHRVVIVQLLDSDTRLVADAACLQLEGPGGVSWRVEEADAFRGYRKYQRSQEQYETLGDFEYLDASSEPAPSQWRHYLACLENLNREFELNLCDLGRGDDAEVDESAWQYKCVRPYPNDGGPAAKVYRSHCCDKSADGNMSKQQCYAMCQGGDSGAAMRADPGDSGSDADGADVYFTWHRGPIARVPDAGPGDCAWDIASRLLGQPVCGVYALPELVARVRAGSTPLAQDATLASCGRGPHYFFVDRTMSRRDTVEDLVKTVGDYDDEAGRFLRHLLHSKRRPLPSLNASREQLLGPFIPGQEMTSLEWERSGYDGFPQINSIREHLKERVVTAAFEDPRLLRFRKHYPEAALRAVIASMVESVRKLSTLIPAVKGELRKADESVGEELIYNLLTDRQYLMDWSTLTDDHERVFCFLVAAIPDAPPRNADEMPEPTFVDARRCAATIMRPQGEACVPFFSTDGDGDIVVIAAPQLRDLVTKCAGLRQDAWVRSRELDAELARARAKAERGPAEKKAKKEEAEAWIIDRIKAELVEARGGLGDFVNDWVNEIKDGQEDSWFNQALRNVDLPQYAEK